MALSPIATDAKYVEGMEKPLADFSERLAKRTGTSEDVLKGKLAAGRLTSEEALAVAEGKVE